MTKKGLTGISLTACAVEIGISPPRLMSLVKEGRVPKNPDGSFDPIAVKAAFEANRDPAQASKISPEAEAPSGRSLAGIRTDREEIKLRRERLELDLEEGRLVRADRMQHGVGGMIVAAKNRLLGMANKLAKPLAAETDPVKIDEAICEEVRLAFSELSKWNPNFQQPNANS